MEIEEKNTQLSEMATTQEAVFQQLSELQRELHTLRVGDLFIGRCKGSN